jgi:predicted RNA-binding protein with EMAP domain
MSRLMNHKKYLQSLLHHIDDKGYKIECECEGEEITPYEAMHDVDEVVINIIDKDGHSLGWVHFAFYNDWDESIGDYTLELENILELDKFIDSQIKT